jgi:hypothetical protein
MESEKMSGKDYELLEKRRVWGWDNAMSVANDLWASIHSSLLAGDLVFAYKDTTGELGLTQIVVVALNQPTEHFSVGMVTSGYTALLPHVPFNFLTSTVLGDLKKYKVDKNIIKAYEQILENYKR